MTWRAEEKAGHTLQPTARVHEAWLKIDGSMVYSRTRLLVSNRTTCRARAFNATLGS
jgi:hypothetical protein